MRIRNVFFISLILLLAVFGLRASSVFADDYQCVTPEEKQACTNLLAQTEQQIADLGIQLGSKKQEGTSLSRDKQVLDLQIKQAQLKIKAHELSIANLGKDITVKTNTITALTGQIDQDHESIGRILERGREIDNLSVAEAFLSNKTLMEFFIDVDAFASIKQSLQQKLDVVKENKAQAEQVKNELSTKRSQELDLKKGIESEKIKVQANQTEKQRLLALNANDQQTYKTQIANKQAEATKIRNALFQLRDSTAIKFGDAVVYARNASAKTGVPAAFILAIIQQESNLGANVGTCYLADATTGSGTRKSSGASVANLMKLSRDVQPFLDITKSLGRDPYKTLVSCPFSTGYGGAMGPAQFIPSTWVLNESRIEASTGVAPADPWNPRDAFMASAFYLGDLGASGGTYSAQRNAACKYYSGRSCSGSNSFYGDQVMGRVQTLQTNIDILQNAQ